MSYRTLPTICLACLASILLAGCGDPLGLPSSDLPLGGDAYTGTLPPSDGPVDPVPPTPAALKARIASLRQEFEALVPAGARQKARDKVAAYPFVRIERAPTPTIQIDPETPTDLWMLMAAEAVFRGSLSTATWCFLEAAALSPEAAFPLSQVGFALNAADRSGEALPFLLAAKAADPDFHPARVNLAVAFEKTGDPWRALLEWHAVVALQPTNAGYLARLAGAYLRLGQRGVASRFLEMARRLAPDDPDVKEVDQAMQTGALRSALGDGSAEVSAVLYEAVTACSTAQIQDLSPVMGQYAGVGGRFWDIEQECMHQFDLAADRSRVCQQGCCTECDACYAACLAVECQEDRAALGVATVDFANGYFEYRALYNGIVEVYVHCCLAAFVDHVDQASGAFEITMAVDSFFTTVDSQAEYINRVPADLDETIQALSDQVQATCDEAQSAFDAIDWEEELARQAAGSSLDLNLDLCFDGVACLGIAGSQVTVNFQGGGVFQGEVSLDFRTGDIGLGFGIGATDPTGTVQAGVQLKLHTAKGVGVGADVRGRGPINVKVGGDFWAFTN